MKDVNRRRRGLFFETAKQEPQRFFTCASASGGFRFTRSPLCGGGEPREEEAEKADGEEASSRAGSRRCALLSVLSPAATSRASSNDCAGSKAVTCTTPAKL